MASAFYTLVFLCVKILSEAIIMLEEIVHYLIQNHISISTMESCTGGLLASLITDIPDASTILKFSAVTYSTEYKIKMGVSKDVIDTYTVYSKETAIEMAKAISEFTGSDLGVGITGRLVSNLNEEKGVDVCLYDRRVNQYYTTHVQIFKDNRKDNKMEVIQAFVLLFNSTIK